MSLRLQHQHSTTFTNIASSSNSSHREMKNYTSSISFAAAAEIKTCHCAAADAMAGASWCQSQNVPSICTDF